MTHHHNSNKKQKTSRHNDDSSHREYKSFDHSLIGESLNLGHKNVAQIAFALTNGTQEVKDLLLNECNIIYECRLCKNMFRSFANLVAHKRIYCKDHQCEQMVLYDPSWFLPEQEKNDVKVEAKQEESVQNPKITFPQPLDSKTLELKRKSLDSIVNSLQNGPQSADDSDTKPISTSQFYSDEKTKKFTNSDQIIKDETSNATLLLAQQSLNKHTSASLAKTSIEESTLKTETSDQESSGETILFNKSSTKDNIMNPSNLLKSLPKDRNEVDESQFRVNKNSSSKAKTVIPTPIVCKKKHNRPNPHSILKLESPNANVQKSPQYGLFLNRHYHSNILPPSIPSKESSSSSSSSIVTNSNVHECTEQVCTKMPAKSNEHSKCNDVHERPANKSRIPIEVITIDSDHDDGAYSDEIYAL